MAKRPAVIKCAKCGHKFVAAIGDYDASKLGKGISCPYCGAEGYDLNFVKWA